MKEILVILGGSIVWLFFIMVMIIVLYWSVFSATAKDQIPE